MGVFGFEVLTTDVQAHLDVVRSVLESVRGEDGLPSSLRERLSEASLLTNTLPTELAERGAYLQSNAALRRDHAALRDQLHAWVRDARLRLDKDIDGVDFPNVLTDLEKHKVRDKDWIFLTRFGKFADMKDNPTQHLST